MGWYPRLEHRWFPPLPAFPGSPTRSRRLSGRLLLLLALCSRSGDRHERPSAATLRVDLVDVNPSETWCLLIPSVAATSMRLPGLTGAGRRTAQSPSMTTFSRPSPHAECTSTGSYSRTDYLLLGLRTLLPSLVGGVSSSVDGSTIVYLKCRLPGSPTSCHAMSVRDPGCAIPVPSTL